MSGEWRVVNGEVSGECGEWWVVSDGSGWAQVVQITPVVQVLSMDLISSAVDLHFASGTRLDTGIRRTPGRIVASGGGGRREISAVPLLVVVCSSSSLQSAVVKPRPRHVPVVVIGLT